MRCKEFTDRQAELLQLQLTHAQMLQKAQLQIPMSLDIENTILTPESSKDHGRPALQMGAGGNVDNIRLIHESATNDEMVMLAMSREGGKLNISPKVPKNIGKQNTNTIASPAHNLNAERYKAAPISLSKDEEEGGYDQDEFNDEETKAQDMKKDGFFLTGAQEEVKPPAKVQKQKTNRSSKQKEPTNQVPKTLAEIDDVYHENQPTKAHGQDIKAEMENVKRKVIDAVDEAATKGNRKAGGRRKSKMEMLDQNGKEPEIIEE